MRARNKPIILDGATGSELIARGLKPHPVLWTANAGVLHFELLKTIHKEYLEAGADVVTANTFRSNPHAFRKLGMGEKEALASLKANVNAARAAVNEFGSGLIAGSIAPLEDCYKVGLVPPNDVLDREHRWIAENLKAVGCDIALIETMGTEREALAALNAARSARFKRVWVSFLVDETGEKLLSGEPLMTVAGKCVVLGAEAVLVNCVHHEVAARSLKILSKLGHEAIFGAYCNSARMKIENGVAKWEACETNLAPQVAEYAIEAVRWRDQLGATVFGGCCGIGRAHIQALATRLTA